MNDQRVIEEIESKIKTNKDMLKRLPKNTAHSFGAGIFTGQKIALENLLSFINEETENG